MARIITKGLIGVEDLALGTSTFTRATSTGGTQTLHQINQTSLPVASVFNFPGQTAGLGPVAFYAVGAGGSGIYRVSTSIIVKNSNAASSVIQVTIGTNNGYISQNFVTGTLDCSLSPGNEFQGSRIFFSTFSVNINLTATVGVALIAGQYDLRVRLEYLG